MRSTLLANNSMPRNYFRTIIRHMCKDVCAKTFTTELFTIGNKCTTAEDWINNLAI